MFFLFPELLSPSEYSNVAHAYRAGYFSLDVVVSRLHITVYWKYYLVFLDF